MAVFTCSANSVTPLGMLMSTLQILVLFKCNCMVKDRSRHVCHTQMWFLLIVPGYMQISELNNSHTTFQWHIVESGIPENPWDFWSAKAKQEYKKRNRKSNRFGSLISHKVIWAWFLLQRKPLIHVFDALFTFHHRLCCCTAFPKKNIYFLFPLFQKLSPHWCFCYADGDNISALHHNFFLLFLQYKVVLHANWFHLGHKHAWHGRSEFPKGAVNYLSYQNRKMTYIKILQITTTKSCNYNLISSGKLSPQHLGVEGQKLPIFGFHQLGRAGFPLPSSLLISPALFFSLCPIWLSEPDWLWSSLAAC